MTELTAVRTEDGAWSFSAVTAAAQIPLAPPDEWFDDPGLDEPTAITVTADGRIFGHVCSWRVRHIGLPGNQTPPHSTTGYREFLRGQVETASGAMVNTGPLSMGGGHAGLNGDLTAAIEHYDDVSSAVGDVAVGEDAVGLWMAGALRPGVTPEQVRTLRGSAVSGDWRAVHNGQLSLCAVLVVNVPGFSVPRAAVAASGAPTALVAAGMILQDEPAPDVPVDVPAAPTDEPEAAAAEEAVVAAPMGPESDRNRDQAGNASKPVPPAPKPAPPPAKKAPAPAAKPAAKKPAEKKSGGSGGKYKEEDHPRDSDGMWAPKNEEAKKAQQDPNAKKNYDMLEKGGKAAADMLGKLSDGDLRALTKFAYSSKTSDPKIVAARVKVAGEMGKRGIDIKKNGAAGGGKKGATRASALVAARRGRGSGSGGYRYSHGWVLLDGSDKDAGKGGGKAGGEGGKPSFKDTAAALRREPLEKALDDLAKTQPEVARRQRDEVDKLEKAGKLTPDRERRATDAAKRAAVPYGHDKAGSPTEGLGADKFGPGKGNDGKAKSNGGGEKDPAGKVLERDGQDQTKAIRDLSDDDLFTAHKELYAARGDGGPIDKAGDKVRGEMARRGTVSGSGVNSALDRVRDNKGANREKTLSGLSRAQLHQVGLAAQKRGAIARSPSEKTAMEDVRTAVRGELARRKPVAAAAAGRSDDMDDDLIDDFEETPVDEQTQTNEPDAVTAASDDMGGAPMFEEGDMVAIGETGLSGQVVADAMDEDPDTMAVVVSVPASMLSKMDEPAQADPAVAAAVAPLAASVAGLTELVASMQAQDRADRASRLLADIPG